MAHSDTTADAAEEATAGDHTASVAAPTPLTGDDHGTTVTITVNSTANRHRVTFEMATYREFPVTGTRDHARFTTTDRDTFRALPHEGKVAVERALAEQFTADVTTKAVIAQEDDD